MTGVRETSPLVVSVVASRTGDRAPAATVIPVLCAHP